MLMKQHCFVKLTGHCPLEVLNLTLTVVARHAHLPVFLVILLKALPCSEEVTFMVLHG